MKGKYSWLFSILIYESLGTICMKNIVGLEVSVVQYYSLKPDSFHFIYNTIAVKKNEMNRALGHLCAHIG